MNTFDAMTLLALAVLLVAGCMFVADHGVRALEMVLDAWMAL